MFNGETSLKVSHANDLALQKEARMKSLRLSRVLLASVMLLLLLYVIPLFAYPPINEEELPPQADEKWENFKTKMGSKWKMRWDSKNSMPKDIMRSNGNTAEEQVNLQRRRRLTKDFLKTSEFDTYEQKARRFIDENSELLRVKSENLSLKHQRVTGTGRLQLQYIQHYNGIPIWNTRVMINMDGNGEIELYKSDYFPILPPISTKPLLQEPAAKRYLQDNFRELTGHDGDIVEGPHLIIYPKGLDNAFYLCWRAILADKVKNEPWEYFINASTAKMIFKRSLLIR